MGLPVSAPRGTRTDRLRRYARLPSVKLKEEPGCMVGRAMKRAATEGWSDGDGPPAQGAGNWANALIAQGLFPPSSYVFCADLIY